MKNWKLKLNISLLFIAFIICGALVAPKITEAACGTTTIGCYDASTRNCNQYTNASLANSCYKVDQAEGIYNRGVDQSGRPLTSAQLDALEEEITTLQYIYDESQKYKANPEANQAALDDLSSRSNYTFNNALQKANQTEQTSNGQSTMNKDVTDQFCYSTPNYIPQINIGACITEGFARFVYILLTLVSWAVGLCGLLFDTVLRFTVLEAKTYLGLPAVDQGWILFRDVGNFFFIFILVYIAVRTILGIDNSDTKILIRNVIIIGLLVNFSLFFTKFLIDISNVFSLFFYNKIVPVGQGTISSISAVFAQTLGIQKIASMGVGDVASVALGGANTDVQSFTSLMTGGKGMGEAFLNIGIYGLGGSLFLIFVAFTFLYASILFILRYLALIFVLIISPIAFFAFVFPNTKRYFDGWSRMLVGMLAFAPLYLLLLFFVLALAKGLVPANGVNIASILGNPKVAATTGSLVDPLLKFALVIGLLNVAAIASTKIASGAGGFVGAIVNKTSSAVAPVRMVQRTGGLATRATASTSGLALRNTVGAASTRVFREGGMLNNYLQRKSADGTFITRGVARATLSGGAGLANANYDLRNTKTAQAVTNKLGLLNVGKGESRNYRQIVEEKAKKYEEDVKTRGGASGETRKKINTAVRGIAENEQLYNDQQITLSKLEIEKTKAEKNNNPEDVAKWTTEINKVKLAAIETQKTIEKHEKDKKSGESQKVKEIEQQQFAYAESRRKWAKRLNVGTNFTTNEARSNVVEKFIKKPKKVTDAEKTKLDASNYADQIEVFNASRNFDNIAKLFDKQIRSKHIKEFEDKVFIDDAGNVKEEIAKRIPKTLRKQLTSEKESDNGLSAGARSKLENYFANNAYVPPPQPAPTNPPTPTA